MSRDEGFAIADISTSKLDDVKFKALWRKLRDEGAMALTCVLYESTQLASWRMGERLTAEDAAPAWITDVATPTAHLVDVGLLDATHRIPRRSWNQWFGSAQKRREETRERWRRSKAKREQQADSSTDISAGSAETPRGTHGGSSGQTVRPSVRQESLSEYGLQQPSARATRPRGLSTRRNGRPEPVGALLEGSELMTPELRAAMKLAEGRRR